MLALYRELSVYGDYSAGMLCDINDVACATLCQAGLPKAPFWIAVLQSNEEDTVSAMLRVV